jgi:hypothetical protein
MIRFWLGLIVGAVLVIALVAFARGRDHRRGDDVGALGDAQRVTLIAQPLR